MYKKTICVHGINNLVCSPYYQHSNIASSICVLADLHFCGLDKVYLLTRPDTNQSLIRNAEQLDMQTLSKVTPRRCMPLNYKQLGAITKISFFKKLSKVKYIKIFQLNFDIIDLQKGILACNEGCFLLQICFFKKNLSFQKLVLQF